MNNYDRAMAHGVSVEALREEDRALIQQCADLSERMGGVDKFVAATPDEAIEKLEAHVAKVIASRKPSKWFVAVTVTAIEFLYQVTFFTDEQEELYRGFMRKHPWSWR